MMQTLTFIGGGNMAASIVGGLIEQNYRPQLITVCDPKESTRQQLQTQFQIHTSDDNIAACAQADIIVLAVKPQILESVTKALQPALKNRSQPPLIISVAAGITCQQIEQWLGQEAAIIRCMPNTPALVRQGATGLYANPHCHAEQKAAAQSLLEAVGLVTWVNEESLIDSITAVAGSSPAYFFLFMEAMIETAITQGLTPAQARALTLQSALGAASLAQQNNTDIAQLRQRVTSPGGTTEQAILQFEQAGLRKIVADAMHHCAEHSKALGQQLKTTQPQPAT